MSHSTANDYGFLTTAVEWVPRTILESITPDGAIVGSVLGVFAWRLLKEITKLNDYGVLCVSQETSRVEVPRQLSMHPDTAAQLATLLMEVAGSITTDDAQAKTSDPVFPTPIRSADVQPKKRLSRHSAPREPKTAMKHSGCVSAKNEHKRVGGGGR
jgi:hypothetical protein